MIYAKIDNFSGMAEKFFCVGTAKQPPRGGGCFAVVRCGGVKISLQYYYFYFSASKVH